MPRILRLFISYAHEDEKIAIAVSNALQMSLGDTLAEVFLDLTSLQAGFDFRTQIADRLDQTDVLVLVYTGVEKPSFSYTGWELGYFQGVQRRDTESGGTRRRIVSLHLTEPPAPIASIQGISFDIDRRTLALSEAEFARALTVTREHPMVLFVESLKDVVADIRRTEGYPPGHAPDTVLCVRDLLVGVFGHLKTTVDKTFKPQKQITIRTTAASLQEADGSLPADAELVPLGQGGAMSVFGLEEAPILWSDFAARVAEHRMGVSWREAIDSVVASSLPNPIDVDNSQVIFSADGSRLYRLILTTSTTFFNGRCEFNIYLVEALRRSDYGDRNTTLLLKGLGMVCRFRFVFLETDSEFHACNVLAMPLDRLPGLCRRLLRELNLMARDARETGLDQPNVWAGFVDWNLVLDMSRQWIPREKTVREVAGAVLHLDPGHADMEPLRQQFAAALTELGRAVGPPNRTLIEQMSERLKVLVVRNGG